MSKSSIIVCLVAVLCSSASFADMIPMRDFIQLKRGMSEAEVLYRVGGYDHETISSDYHHQVIRKTWFYIPENKSSNNWITEIVFDSRGIVQQLERYKVNR